MKRLLILLLTFYQRQYRLKSKINGFTLLELMISLVMAFIIITPLFEFMFNIMNNDRQQQSKATTEQEVQAAISFIAQDLEEAVYIYDSEGLNNNLNTNSANTSGIKDQIPPLASAPGCSSPTYTCTPVLVFWKREVRQGVLPPNNDDTFVYALVAYYLIQGNGTGETWSNAARISRFEITDGVTDPTNPNNYVTNQSPTPGFKPFNLNLSYSSIQQKMERWQKGTAAYNTPVFTLVDYIDSATSASAQPDCTKLSTNAKLVGAGGFYACIDSSTTIAQIYIRGNAMSRLNNGAAANCDTPNNLYCPTVTLQIKGRGLLDAG